MPETISVPASELSAHVGDRLKGYGIIKQAAVVQPGGDIVYVQYGDGFGRGEKTFPPNQLVEVEVVQQEN